MISAMCIDDTTWTNNISVVLLNQCSRSTILIELVYSLGCFLYSSVVVRFSIALRRALRNRSATIAPLDVPSLDLTGFSIV